MSRALSREGLFFLFCARRGFDKVTLPSSAVARHPRGYRHALCELPDKELQ
jgi:hypothetical protein